MARPSLLQLSDISLTFGGDPIFDGLDLVVHQGDRVALVGRNGSGKSTLMKVMAGLTEPDTGSITSPQGTSVGYMEQEPYFTGFATLGDFATATLGPSEAWRVEALADGLKLRLDADPAKASGGERRRAALARLLAEEPDIMLLDEPTNHLDIEAIGWLEARLEETRTAFVVISHDRAFLNALTRATLWVDRGQVRRNEQGFASFEAWRDKVWDEEDTARHKLDRKIKSEARWAVEGISARRKRNQGRVRALADLRAERAAMIRRQSTAAMVLEEGSQSGRKVIEAKGISKSFVETQILKPFDLRILRGDRVGFVGPNGAGKTTLLNLLTGQLAPDTGQVTLGKGLEMAVFDQNRAGLNPEASLWDSLTLDREIAVNGSSDQVMVRGSPRHVMGYLKDFLFDEAQARAPVRSLSGGERARLMLAKIMARESNLLILDEPTNDLDIETLDLLQDLLGDYAGTVLLVSHDRDFLDRVATSTVVLEGQGRAQVYAGGWSDALAQGARIGAAQEDREAPPAAKSGPDRVVSNAGAKPAAGLSFTETHRLNELPSVIARLEAEMGKLSELLSDPDLYTREPVKFAKATEALAERQAKLAAAEEEWLLLEEKAQGV
ncbi:ABC-F family ATP-binding cassette domain-containing protein [Roseobacter sp. HKCCA0882]|uniref:ABC-F family ATP-binding cassette domain-containing protein n=1 Tax=Roseobacter sp. HKCCA0882 TaxID=3120337 RepID=UPI0030EE9AEB